MQLPVIFNLFYFHHPVSNADMGLDILRRVRLLFQFLSQSRHEDPQGGNVIFPDVYKRQELFCLERKSKAASYKTAFVSVRENMVAEGLEFSESSFLLHPAKDKMRIRQESNAAMVFFM